MTRKWLPSFGELVDRLSIHQLKEVLLPENKEKYFREMQDITHDIDLLISDKNIQISAELIHCVILLAQMNAHIWYNEAKARRGEDQDLRLLKLTHGLNGIRTRVMNKILELIGEAERQDKKTDCLAAEFSDWDVGLLK